VKLECRYAEDTMPRGVLGLNAPMFEGYLRFIANCPTVQISLDALLPNEKNPFLWTSAMALSSQSAFRCSAIQGGLRSGES
jgi:ribonucleoside-diphosphate reductase beta chain